MRDDDWYPDPNWEDDEDWYLDWGEGDEDEDENLNSSELAHKADYELEKYRHLINS